MYFLFDLLAFDVLLYVLVPALIFVSVFLGIVFVLHVVGVFLLVIIVVLFKAYSMLAEVYHRMESS
ncbi:hypothetical protein M426DRAFT_131439 [Hypoxylon sp. CI-4A]|nr:hypothetical protein M426DRAFT_131439 [Hypoxylon sp. CI-4A]